ncbi:glycosyl transferase group 1 [Clostridia bacterium]|nr:glycosyl transferase group 1 [Clostridia bacterium]
MKIIQVISDSNIGGAGRYLLTFFQGVDKNNFGVYLPKGSKLIPEIERLGVFYRELDYIAEKSFDRRAVAELRRLLRADAPDIVHTHAAMSARIAAKFTKAKIVYTRHSVFEPAPRLTKFPLKQVNGSLNNFFSDKIIAVSPAAKDNLTAAGVPPDKIEVIYNGVFAAKTYQNLSELYAKYGLAETDFVAAIIGRLTPVKGHRYLLQAAEILRSHQEIKFIIAGTGECADEILAEVSARNLTNVVFAGFVREIDSIENIMDVQINASYGTEATSLSLLEGMSLGKPAIVSDFGGNPYVIENGVNGFVTAQKDPKAIAEKILILKQNKHLYAKMEKSAIEIYKTKFTAEKMTAEILDLYERVLKNG